MPPNDAIADPDGLVAELRAERDAALTREAALAEVLAVINRSPGDPGPVFEAILHKAHSLCGATIGSLQTYDGTYLRTAAAHGYPPDHFANSGLPFRPTAANSQRLIEGARLVHYADVAAMPEEIAGNFRHVVELGVRTILLIPLRKDGTYVGGISALRTEVKPFTEAEISLLESFAAQAVIAIETARLLREQREALERQTAFGELLTTINTSPGNLPPVFDMILEMAHRTCGAAVGMLAIFERGQYRAVATHGYPEQFASQVSRPVDPYAPQLALLRGDRIWHVPDARAVEWGRDDQLLREFIDLTGVRTYLLVPLRRDRDLLGFIGAHRLEVRPFSETEIGLLENFAAQAVIAMENARLLTETREALEQQTATAEVLQVINASPGDLAPVFQAILEKAMRLCEAAFGGLFTYDGERFHTVAGLGTPAGLTELRTRHPPSPVPGSTTARLLETRRSHHILDRAQEPDYLAGEPGARAMVELGGARSMLNVPLLKEDRLLGFISIYRQEVRPFSEKQIALLQNFAAQAVVAMENARLINETREALDQQTATAEVLQVINSSPGNLAPVFDTILDKAHTLCGAPLGSLMLYEDGYGHAAATHGLPESHAALARKPFRPSGKPQDLIDGARLVHTPDVRSEELHPDDDIARSALESTDIRTGLWVPLRKDGALLGWISAFRLEVRPFSDKEIALLESFAAQAVIAVENARLLTETREALEQQTATAEVLQVINSSPGDVTPVLDAILEKAHALCGAATGMLLLYDGALFYAVATRGYPENYVALLREPFPPGAGHQALIQGDRLFHVPDMQSVKQSVLLPSIEARLRLFIELGLRTELLIPLRKDSVLLGIISAARREVRPFSDKEIALLENFAAQAVIAMENARLLSEIRQRQEELRVTFEHMGDGVAMFDETQRLVAWNGKFQEIFDLPDALLGRRCTYEEYLQFLAARGDFGAGVDTVEQIEALVARTGQSYGYERTRPDGRVIEIRRNPVPDGGFVLIYSDITERKRSEAEIRAARDAAEAAYRDLKAAQANLIQAEKMASLGQLTAGIAHEIKNPLNFVNNFASLSVDLLDELKATAAPGFATLDADRHAEIDELTRTLASNLEKINEHGRRADGIVRSMLDHSRGSSGERRSVDLNVLVDKALNLAYHGARAQYQNFNITLQRDLGDGIAPITLAPQDITRVLLNLFGNGFYAARRRQQAEAAASFEPTLKVATRELGDAVEIKVRDNGIGIPTETRDKLFQPFFTTKPTGEGTGLGLSISYDIVVQQHGGTISVDSKVDEYSEFTVMLPRSR